MGDVYDNAKVRWKFADLICIIYAGFLHIKTHQNWLIFELRYSKVIMWTFFKTQGRT